MDHAALFAYNYGCELDTFITVLLPDDIHRLEAWLRKKISAHLARHVGMAAFVWVRETEGGHHLHILAHLGDLLPKVFRRVLERWIASDKCLAMMGRFPANLLQVRRIPLTRDPVANIRDAVAYLAKGGDNLTREAAGCILRDQGGVIGQRCGVSREIDRAARRAAGVYEVIRRKPTAAILEEGRRRCERWRRLRRLRRRWWQREVPDYLEIQA
jgi:hypothetical protein